MMAESRQPTSSLACVIDIKNNESRVECPFPFSYPIALIYEQQLKLYTTEDGIYQVHTTDYGAESKRVYEGAVTGLAKTDDAVFAICNEMLLEAALGAEFRFTALANMPRVLQVACGRKHMLVLDANHHVHSRGSGPAVGRGQTFDSPPTTELRVIPELTAVAIAAGHYHSAAIEDEPEYSELMVSQGATLSRQMSQVDQLVLNAREMPSSIEERFVREVVSMDRLSTDLSHEYESLDLTRENDILRNLRSGSYLKNHVKVWGRGEDYRLGLGTVADQPNPQIVPGISGVLKVVCGAEHTVVLTTQYQIYVWGKYHPEVVDKKPVLVGRGARTCAVDVAAGHHITMVAALNANRSEVQVVDKNHCLQSRPWITKQVGQNTHRLLQTMSCIQDEPGRAVAIIFTDTQPADVKASDLTVMRAMMNKLRYSLCIHGRHLVDFYQAFMRRWPVVPTELSRESNIIKTFAFLVENLSLLILAIHRLVENLTSVTCRLPYDDIEKRELLNLCTDYYEAYEAIFLAFKDISAFNGFSAVVRKYKANMQNVLKDLKITKRQDTEIAEELRKQFEQGLCNFSDLINWNNMDFNKFPLMKEKFDRLMMRGEQLFNTLTEVTDSAEIVTKDLSHIKEKFFARGRRVIMMSQSVPVNFFCQNELFRHRDVRVILTKRELILNVGTDLYIWNLKIVWLDENITDDSTSVNIYLPEMTGQLAGVPEKLRKWTAALQKGIRSECRVRREEEEEAEDGEELEQAQEAEEALVEMKSLSFRNVVHSFMFGDHKGCIYQGEWKTGAMHGNGRFSDNNSAYEGSFVNNLRKGYGKLMTEFSDGVMEQRVGSWENDHLNGYAEVERFRLQTPKKGTSLRAAPERLLYFKGYYVNNKRQGMGKLVELCDVNGEVVYLGNWADGLRSGYGIERCGSQKAYFGGWKDDQRYGKGREINFVTGEITEKEWSSSPDGVEGVKAGHNYRYEGSLVNDSPCGSGVLTYMLPGFTVTVEGFLTMQESSWHIKEGNLTIEPRPESSLMSLEEPAASSRKWGAFVEQCKRMLLPPTIQKKYDDTKAAVQCMWQNHMPQKLIALQATSLNMTYSDYFADFACRDSITAEDWEMIVRFCYTTISNFETFPLSFFIEHRSEVFSYFVGVNNKEILNIVKEELQELRSDTYELLRVIFPTLPVDINASITLEGTKQNVKGHDLVYAVLPSSFYTQLVAIFNASCNDAQRFFIENNRRYAEPSTFLEQGASFPSDNTARLLIEAILTDMKEFPDGSDVDSENQNHFMDIVKKIGTTFSDETIKNAQMAFAKLDEIETIHRMLTAFVGGVKDGVGSDHILPIYVFLLWKAAPQNLGLHLSLIEKLTDHREGAFEASGFALSTMTIAFHCLSNRR